MKLTDLDYIYPEGLVATERAAQSRLMWVEDGRPSELGSVADLLEKFQAGDLLVINNTKVLRRRIFTQSGLEILFLQPFSIPSASDETSRSAGNGEQRRTWQVLCPSSRWKSGVIQVLPQGVGLKILERGRPQIVQADRDLNEEYFEACGEMPLPPYIQKARGERHNRAGDAHEYQTAWAEKPGSLAAPTASLHFSTVDLAALRARGVRVEEVTLHVGLGTFLPITAPTLDEHVMHEEWAEISASAWRAVEETRETGHKIWALGTTVTRTLESAAAGRFGRTPSGGFLGVTDLFIKPGFQFQVVDRLLTNFHQPQSTLLALVSAFAGLPTVRRCYQWAIANQFRLFSYGDLSIWTK